MFRIVVAPSTRYHAWDIDDGEILDSATGHVYRNACMCCFNDWLAVERGH